jgi:hypothetical protein
MVCVRTPLTLAEFAGFLRAHCRGDWWPDVYRLAPTPEWGPCEACGWHPLTAEHAAEINRVFDRLRELGAPSPGCCYPHCEGAAFAEWYGDDGARVVLDFFCRFGRDAMLSRPGKPAVFVKLGDD